MEQLSENLPTVLGFHGEKPLKLALGDHGYLFKLSVVQDKGDMSGGMRDKNSVRSDFADEDTPTFVELVPPGLCTAPSRKASIFQVSSALLLRFSGGCPDRFHGFFFLPFFQGQNHANPHIISIIHHFLFQPALFLQISNNPDAYALKRAGENNIPGISISPKDYEDREVEIFS